MNAGLPTGPVSLDDCIRLIRNATAPLATERVTLEQALGRVLRETVHAAEDQPPFDRAAVDGYAIRSDDLSEAFRMVDSIRAGDWKPRELSPGETVLIATGAALPGVDLQVVMKEWVRTDGEQIFLLDRGNERNIRFRGEDAKRGQALVQPGRALNPGMLGLLASVGCGNPLVTRLPLVLHLTTGDELVSPEQTPSPGQIRDSNSTLVRSFLHRQGIHPIQLRVPEDQGETLALLQSPRVQIERVDLLLISGGASVGPHDFTADLLTKLGFDIQVRRTKARPGKPLIIGSRGTALAFGLPGNPLAHFACLNLYVRQALSCFAGETELPDFQEGRLAADVLAHPSSDEMLWPARLERGAGESLLTLLRWQSSGDLTSLAEANALVRIPADSGPFKKGSSLWFVAT